MAQAVLLNHWKFDQPQLGVMEDRTGSLPASVDRYVPVKGPAGPALKFSQADGARVVTLGGSDVPPPWTCGVWVRREKSTDGCSLISSPQGAIKLEQWPSRNVLGITRFGVQDWTIEVGLPLNVWAHLTVVAVPGETRFYIDGKEVGMVPASIELPRGLIGSTGGYVEFLEASIAELQLYKGVVEVGALYEPPERRVTSAGESVQEAARKPELVLKQYFSYTNIYEVPIKNGDVTTFKEHRSRDSYSSLAYYIENHGTSPLRIEGLLISNPIMFIPTIDIGTPKGTLARYPVEVKPGGRYIILLVYHPQGRPRPHTTKVTLRTNDPEKPQITWTVHVA